MFKPLVERNEFVVNSLMDTDVYKLNMGLIFCDDFPYDKATYAFKCRNKNVIFTGDMYKDINKEVDHLCGLKFTNEELIYLENNGFPDYYTKFDLSDFQLNKENTNIFIDDKKSLRINLDSKIGSLFDVSMFEIYLLKIVHEVYSRHMHPNFDLSYGRQVLMEKIRRIKEFEKEYKTKLNIVDFGTRRAFSGLWHEEVVSTLIENDVICGTSNVLLAMKYKVPAIGTMAHEFVQTFQAFTHPMLSQKKAFETWNDKFGYNLGIYLHDTLGNDKFFKDFDEHLSRTSKGTRHDSGDPFEYGEMVINHYNKFGINPKDKIIVFSDGLDIDKMFELYKRFGDRIGLSFGIGTNLTNDVGVEALQNVIKQTSVNGLPTAKISNNLSKSMCEDEHYFNYMKYLFVK